MISNWCTLAAPWRCDVPRQSAPVSPPPMMTTFLSLAVIGGSPSSPTTGSPFCTRLAQAGTPSPGGCRRVHGRGDRQVAPVGRTAGQHHGVVVQPQLCRGEVDADVDPGAERRALGHHLLQTAVDVALLHLELGGDAVAQQTTDAVGTLEHRHLMAGPRQLLCRSQTRGSRPTTATFLLVRRCGGRGKHPSLVEGVVDDLDLDLLDGHRILVDAEHARRLARGPDTAAR